MLTAYHFLFCGCYNCDNKNTFPASREERVNDMNNNGQQFPQNDQYQQGGGYPPPQPPKKKNTGCIIAAIIVAVVVLFMGIMFIGCAAVIGSRTSESSNSQISGSEVSPPESTGEITNSKQSSEVTQQSSEISKSEESSKEQSSKEDENITENTYENNTYYEITETASFTDIIKSTHLIHKVKAKKDVTIDATIIAYAEDGSIIDKSTSSITLTKGESNYFEYYFKNDVSNAKLQATAKPTNDSLLTTGERNAVEMVTYNKSGNDLFITVKQVKDKIGGFAKYKLLFYKDGTIVDTEEGYFSVGAQNLSAKDTTDVITIPYFKTDFDTLEFIYEP